VYKPCHDRLQQAEPNRTKVNMTKIDPIIAVKDVKASSQWYQFVFGCKKTHGGKDFAVLEDENDEILICLHQ
jgi:hypothetical protein